MTTEPKWSTTPPTVTGYYWWRYLDDKAQVLDVFVRQGDGSIMAHQAGVEETVPTSILASGEWWPVAIEEPPR